MSLSSVSPTPETLCIASSYRQRGKPDHALFIAEMLDLVCGMIATSDCVQLLRTCRSVFLVAVPRVWRSVPDARVLIHLVVIKDESETYEIVSFAGQFKSEPSADEHA
jgi:hypothetical protein